MWLWMLLNVFFLQKTDFRRWFSLSSLLFSVIFLFVVIGPCCFIVFQYCCEMLNMESICKAKGVHILFLFTTFPLLILLDCFNPGYLQDSLYKRRKTSPLGLLFLKFSGYAADLSSGFLLLKDRIQCLLTFNCNILKRNERFEGVNSNIQCNAFLIKF